MKKFCGLALAVLIGCSDNSSDSGFTTAPAPALKAVSVVPENFKVLINAVGVVLDGSKSYDPVAGAPAPTYLWEQTSGTSVVLSPATAVSPTFTAPPTPGDLTFRLTVTGAQGADTATVTVSVKTFLVTAPDKWFVGYGNPGTITATVTGTTTAPTYQWTGLESWLTVGALNTLVLSYTAPAITDFQNYVDRAGVLLMERSTMGRLQLKIKVSDGLLSDEDYVNFSVGSFPGSVANENIALGEPAFLNGAATIPTSTTPIAITTWTWTGVKPNGTAVSFFKANKSALSGATTERYIYFVPDLVGSYEVQVRQNNGNPEALTKVIDITCGTYVGVGNLTGTVPDPFVGECASCHAGQFGWLADFANPWKQTRHATVFSSLLDPTDPLYAASQAKIKWVDAFNFGSEQSIDSRTVGWSQISSKPNAGWAELASAEGYAFHGSSWDELVRKHPKTAGKSNVQCESCHGPGSEHAGDSTAIRKSYDAVVCGRCHSTKLDLWEMSAHSSTTSNAFNSASGSTSCNGCHTAQGFIVEMRAQEGADPYTALFAVGNVARPVLPLDDRRSITCQTCHEPHKKTANMPVSANDVEPQLRAYGNVKLRNDAVVFGGISATCYECHQSRTDARPNSVDMNARRAPHDSTAAEMLSATNGNEIAGWVYQSSPHADKTRFVVAGRSEARQCVTCHNDVTPSLGQSGYGALGGHSFQMAQGDGTATVNDGTFGAGLPTVGTRKFALTGPSGTASFLRRVVPGDILVLTGGADAGSYVVGSVDGARQVTVTTAGSFTGAAPTNWSISSVPKYNVAACNQCHTTASDFRDTARGDYDGNGLVEPIQDKIQGLLDTLQAAIEAKLTILVGSPSTLTPASGKVKYTITAGTLVRVFPGPSTTSSDNPDISWASLTQPQKDQWSALYQASYNWVFVKNDGSEGIHNTGYAVNLLQSSYKAVTGTVILNSQPFVPF